MKLYCIECNKELEHERDGQDYYIKPCECVMLEAVLTDDEEPEGLN